MALSNTLVFTAVISCLLVIGRADLCAPDCRGGSDLYPHPQNCGSFYQCSYGTAFLQHCPASLEFSPTNLRCDYPAQAGCTADPSRECEAGSPVTPPPVTSAPSECTPACPTPEALYPHPHDCTKYFHCAYNVPYLKSCPAGQQYSGPLQRCDYPDIAKCTAHADAPCVAATNAPTTASPKSCAPKCPWANAYIPHPQDCTKFYICGGMVPFESSCQPGLLYDMKLVRCEYPENAFCIASPDRACDEYLQA